MPEESQAASPLRLSTPSWPEEPLVVELHSMPDGRKLWRFVFGEKEEA